MKDNSLLSKDFRKGELSAGTQGPAGPSGPAGPAGPAGATGPQGAPGLTQFARVKSNGALVNGTAVSSSKLATGTYVLIFSTAITNCAATAASTSFVGYDGSVFRIDDQISVGFSVNGSTAANTVTVNLYDGTTGAATDSSFSLILACP